MSCAQYFVSLCILEMSFFLVFVFLNKVLQAAHD